MERVRIDGVLGLLDPGKCAGAMVEAVDEVDPVELYESSAVLGVEVPLVAASMSTLVAASDAACDPGCASVFKPFDAFDLSFMSDILDPPILSPVKKSSDRMFLSVSSYDPETFIDQLASRALQTPATRSSQRSRKRCFVTPTKPKTVKASSPKTVKPSPKAKTVKASSKTVKPSPKAKTVKPSPKTVKPSPKAKTVKPSPKTVKPSPQTVKASPKTVKPSPETVKASPQTVKPSRRQTVKGTGGGGACGGGGGAGGGGGGGGANDVEFIMTPKCVKSRAYYKAKMIAKRAGKSDDEARRLGRVAYHAI